ncbi:MAG: tetratricopeptide repeat protein [Bacteroidales bacterium]|nr:tetratricopeptide repeat protein [Bacteroidales bacterium]
MNIKKTILTICLIALAAPFNAQTLQEAEQAYQTGNYEASAEIYEQILHNGQESFVLYYNLGNCYYRLNQNGLAILNYERALRIKPSDSDAKENLALAESRTTDRIAAIPQFLLAKWYTSVVQLLTPRGWRTLLLCLLAICCAAIVILMLSNDYRQRRTMALIGFVSVILLAATIAVTISASIRASRHDYAVVTQQAIVVKGAPEYDSVDKFIIHEGTKAKVDETLGGWHKIRLSDGTTGWVPISDIEII